MSRTATSVQRNHEKYWVWCVAAITIAGAALRLVDLGKKSLWLDEGISVAIARLDWRNLAALLWRREANMSLYYVLLRGWLHFGSSEFFIRLFSTLAGAAAVPFTYFLGKRCCGRDAGLPAAIFMAANSFAIFYSQQARSYALVMVLCMAATLIFCDVIGEAAAGRRREVGYSVVAIAAIYSHFFAALVVVAHGIAALFLPREAIGKRKMIRLFLPVAIASLPLLAFVLHTRGGQLDWVPRLTLESFRTFWIQLAGDWELLAIYVLGSCASVGRMLIEARRPAQPATKKKNWLRWILVVWLLLPVAITLALSIGRPVFYPRFLIIVLPAFILLAADGISGRPKWMQATIVAIAVAFSFPLWRQIYRAPQEDWRAATAYIQTHSGPGDGIVFFLPLGRMPYEYYVSRGSPGGAAPHVIFPAHGEKLTRRDFEGTKDVAINALEDAAPQIPNIWLVLTGDRDNPDQERLEHALANRYKPDGEQKFYGLRVVKYARSAKQ